MVVSVDSSPGAPPPGPVAVIPPVKPPAPAPAPVELPRTAEVRHVGSAREPSLRAVRWFAQGAVKILGDVDVSEARLSGQVGIGGRCTAGELVALGPLEILGDCRVSGKLTAHGSLHIGGSLEAGDLDARGPVFIGGPARVAFNWKSVGEAHVNGNLKAAEVEFDGRLTVAGDIEARRVHGRLVGTSGVRTIRADEVTLRRPSGFLPSPRGTLDADRIEAQLVHLEGVDCEYIVAEEIRLGPHTHVTAVEGRVVERHATAHVGPESRSLPPHGLWR